MKVIILGSGTSQGIPVIGCKCETCLSKNPKDKRLRTSAYIVVDDLKILIDTSIDFRQQMLKYNVTDIDAVLFTHHHVDHILGLDDLRQINQRLNKFIDLYGNGTTIDEIKITFRYAFNKLLIRYKVVPLINLHEIENKKFKIRNVEITPIEVRHGKIKIFGYRIGNFAYITDCSKVPDSEIPKLENLDVLIVNALRRAPHPTHFNIEQAVELSQRVTPRKTYLTHMTHDINNDKTNKTLPANVELTYDGLEFNL
ncbi:MAG: MBL fold metallo-hydrolase [Ignavibacteria bacterium]|nr:MBL fold metallo-hydrolase [Ignavibacteria bacterium]